MAKTKTPSPPKRPASGRKSLRSEMGALRQRLEEAEDSLTAIRTGAVDALVIKGPAGDQIYTLKDADRPYRIIIENMRDGAITIRENGLVLYANRQFAAMLGLPLESLLGSNLLDLTGPSGRDGLQRLIDRAATAGATSDVEFRASSGKPLLMHLSLAPMKIDSIQVLSGVIADITEERRTQQKVRQMERTEALGRLAGGVAHDLNNILQPILVNAELLLGESESDPGRQVLLKNIIDAAHRQRDLVTKILSFTRQAKQVMRPVAVTPLVSETLKLLKPSLPRGVEIRLTADSTADTIMGDPSELQELVTNLCTNAVDALEAKGGVVEVLLHDAVLTQENAKLDLRPGRYLRLAVKDAGCGIPPHDLERIFDPFFTTKEAGRGTGIGLSVVRGIVRGHGGSISVESEVNKGTEVTVFLPATDVAQIKAAGGDLGWKKDQSRRRILVVDDDGLVLDAMQRALTSFGHMATTIQEPARALAIFRTLPNRFDLAIVDQTMPRMSGLELAAEIRKINPALPILLATGYSRATDEKALLAAGVTGIILKPLCLKDLAAAVANTLAVGAGKASSG